LTQKTVDYFSYLQLCFDSLQTTIPDEHYDKALIILNELQQMLDLMIITITLQIKRPYANASDEQF